LVIQQFQVRIPAFAAMKADQNWALAQWESRYQQVPPRISTSS
jgi:hypothetical protein